MRRALVTVTTVVALLAPVTAASASPVSAAEAQRIESGLTYRSGTLVVHEAQIALPTGFRYLGATDAQLVLTKIYGNPPDTNILALVVPPDTNVLTATYDVVVTYDDGGHISDSDAASTNWTEQLAQIKQDASDRNDQRVRDGYPKLDVVRWAEPPRYDATTHKLYWAKDILFGDSPVHQMNYDVRVLGREGVLDLSAVATVNDLPAVREGMQTILQASSFTSGRGYADYKDGDRTSELTIAALVAGGAAVAVKTGLLATIGALLLKGKFLLLGLLALIRPIGRRLKRRSKPPTPTSGADDVDKAVDVSTVVPEPDRGTDGAEPGDRTDEHAGASS